jgi:hypothetical protein
MVGNVLIHNTVGQLTAAILIPVLWTNEGERQNSSCQYTTPMTPTYARVDL